MQETMIDRLMALVDDKSSPKYEFKIFLTMWPFHQKILRLLSIDTKISLFDALLPLNIIEVYF